MKLNKACVETSTEALVRAAGQVFQGSTVLGLAIRVPIRLLDRADEVVQALDMLSS